jgi:hypothetical protein
MESSNTIDIIRLSFRRRDKRLEATRMSFHCVISCLKMCTLSIRLESRSNSLRSGLVGALGNLRARAASTGHHRQMYLIDVGQCPSKQGRSGLSRIRRNGRKMLASAGKISMLQPETA